MLGAREEPRGRSPSSARALSKDPDVITPHRLVSWPPEVPAAPHRADTPFGHASSHHSSISAAGVESRAPAPSQRSRRLAGAILAGAIVAALFIIVLGGTEPNEGAAVDTKAVAVSSGAVPAREGTERTSNVAEAPQRVAAQPDASAPVSSNETAAPPDVAEPSSGESAETSPGSNTRALGKTRKPKGTRSKPARERKSQSDLGLRPSR